jgi:thioredoxin reductase (NADPH)
VDAARVILATGVVDNPLPLPELADAVARGLVRICPICDGLEAADQSIGVIGADDHAAAEAVFLTNWSDRVSLIHVAATGALSADARADLAGAGVALIEAPIDSVTLDRRRITAICAGPGGPRQFDCLYSALGVAPRNALAVGAGATLDESGRLIVNDHQETSVPGLYAAGDVVRGLNQISTAAGEGAIAATDVHNSLRRTTGTRRS